MSRAALLLAIGAAVVCSSAGARSATSYYQFTARFGFVLIVSWTSESGSRTKPCSSWSSTVGKYKVNAESSRTLPGILQVNAPGQRPWAPRTGAGGPAHVVVNRTRVDRSGTTRCDSTPAKELPAPANDCGEREYDTVASLFATQRLSFETLDDITSEEEKVFSFPFAAFSVSVPAQGLLYRKCELSGSVPGAAGAPGSLAVRLDDADVRALRTLRPGRTHRLSSLFAGKCRDDIPDGETCQFKLGIHIDIRRTT